MKGLVVLFASLVFALMGCAGDAVTPVPPPAGGPIMIQFAVTNTSGNADPTPFDEAHLLRVVTLNPGNNVRAFARVEYSGSDPAIYRSPQLFIPIEPDLVEGRVFNWDDSDNQADYYLSVNNYHIEDLDHDEQVGQWGRGHGTFTVTKKEGRVVTLAVDATLNGQGAFSEGSFRLQGNLVIDFAQWQTPE